MQPVLREACPHPPHLRALRPGGRLRERGLAWGAGGGGLCSGRGPPGPRLPPHPPAPVSAWGHLARGTEDLCTRGVFCPAVEAGEEQRCIPGVGGAGHFLLSCRPSVSCSLDPAGAARLRAGGASNLPLALWQAGWADSGERSLVWGRSAVPGSGGCSWPRGRVCQNLTDCVA